MTVIEKINVLRRRIANGGGCSGIDCEECKETLFSSVDKVEEKGCREIHEYLGIPFDADVHAISKEIVNLAKQELVRILRREHRK